MKKGILFILGMFMMVSTAEANDGIPNTEKLLVWEHSTLGYRPLKAQPIQFIEKGVKFYVYSNGQVDFNLRSRPRNYRGYNYQNNRRYGYSSARVYKHAAYDYLGRVKRVGNVRINYNRLGKVSRIGSVYVNYQRRRITRIGGLHIKYNRYGEVKYLGSVKPKYNYRPYRYDAFYNGMVLDYDNDYFINDSFYNDFEDYDEDEHYYYYKSKKDKGKKQQTVIKRKKALKKDIDKRKKR